MIDDRDPATASWAAFEGLVGILTRRYKARSNEADPHAKPPRVVLILGAGVSLWSKMPLWNDVKEDIITAACNGFHEFLSEACMRLETTLGTDGEALSDAQRRRALIEKASTEQICAVACTIERSKREVLRRLRELYKGPGKAGPPPQLAYELIAHLLKHEFADHVITFNFDDLMATAMMNELGPDEFELVTSDHTAVDAREPSLSVPRVIQLHGSVNSEPTLRFTLDSTGVLTPHTKRLLWDTMFEDGRPLHIVSLGYSWNDQDITQWIEAMEEKIESLTIVALPPDPPSRLARCQRSETLRLSVLSTEKIVPEGEPPLSIDHVLWAVWELLAAQDYDASPQPAARHLIMGNLFGPQTDMHGRLTGDMRNAHTPELRFGAEVLLHAIKCQGMVGSSVMARDLRIRRYRNKIDANEFEEVLGRLLTPGEYPEVRETLFSAAAESSDFVEFFRQLGFQAGLLLKPFADPSSKTISLREVDWRVFCEKQIETIQNRPEIEIVRSEDPRTKWIFKRPEQLRSFAQLEQQTSGILKKDWNQLLAVAETGEWLTRDPFKTRFEPRNRERQVLMINAALPSDQEWPRKKLIDRNLDEWFEKHETDGVTIRRALMPWWQHNRHLTLAVGESGRFLGAIFFQRPNRASRIAPVLLTEAEDCAEVLITFLTYVRRALERVCFESMLKGGASQSVEAAEVPSTFLEGVQAVVQSVLPVLPGPTRRRVKAASDFIDAIQPA